MGKKEKKRKEKRGWLKSILDMGRKSESPGVLSPAVETRPIGGYL